MDSRIRTYIENPFFDGYFENTTKRLVENITLNLNLLDQNNVLIQEFLSLSQDYWRIDHNILYNDVYKLLSENYINGGTYKISYNLFNTVFGDALVDTSKLEEEQNEDFLPVPTGINEYVNNQLSISSISESRTEIKLSVSSLIPESKFIEFRALKKIDNKRHFLDWKFKTINNKLIQIINFSFQLGQSDHFIIKLDEPLDNEIELGETGVIILPLVLQNSTEITIYPTNNDREIVALKQADFSVKANSNGVSSSDFKSKTDLISENDQISTFLLGKHLSSGSFGIDLNIDYKQFENFIWFSSAEKRLETFKYKLEQIEDLNSSIDSLYSSILPVSSSVVDSVEFGTNILKFKERRTELIQSFDHYENYLYYASSSYESSSYGEFDSSSWPKEKSGSLYVPIHTSSSLSTNWYSGMISSASFFDRENNNSLAKFVPDFIVDDEYNEQFITFINSIGHFFDNIWVYIKDQDVNRKQDESLSVGIPNDLIYNYLKSFGWESINDNQLDDLWEYSIGVDQAGQSYSTSSFSVGEQLVLATSESMPRGQISQEFWKRIFNNLPYLLKSKGTADGVRALINCYGVPATILKIKEFGGPEQINRKSYNRFDKFTYAIDFDATLGASIGVLKGPLQYSGRTPNTIEFRFKTVNANLYETGIPVSLQTQYLLKRDDDLVEIVLDYSTKQFGTIKIYVDSTLKSETPLAPFFNGEWWSFMLRHNELNDSQLDTQTFDVFAKQSRWYDINYQVSSSFSLLNDGSRDLQYFFEEYTWRFGSVQATATAYPFHGQFQEFRYWCNPLTEAEFDNHVLAPTSIFTTSSFDNLGLRFPLGSDLKTLNYTSSIYSKHPDYTITEFDQNDGELSGSFLFSSTPYQVAFSPNVEYYSLEYPDLSANRQISNKIRIEQNSTTGTLDQFSSHEDSAFDYYPSDSNKIGVYFSPSDEINNDIAEQMGGFRIDDYIGGWDNFHSGSYAGLRLLKQQYSRNFYNKFNTRDYVRLMDFYSNSLFNQIKEITPLRAKKILGFVIEPTLLERSKIAFTAFPPVFTNLVHNAIVNYTGSAIISSNNISDIQGSISLDPLPINGGNIEMVYSEPVNYIFEIDSLTENNITVMEQRRSTSYLNYPRSGSNSADDFAAVSNFRTKAMNDLYYAGCRISSPAINVASADTPDGKAVVEVFLVNPNNLESIKNDNVNGKLIVN